MIYLIYLTIILVEIGMLAGVQAASVVALDDDLDEKVFVADEKGSLQETVGTLHLFLHKYVNTGTKACVYVLSIQPVGVSFLLDSVQVTCDVAPPFHNVQGIVNIADVVYVSATPGRPVWALYRLEGDSGCAQRRYTDEAWAPLDEVDEMHLSKEQCFQVILTREYSTVGEPMPHPEPEHNLPFPEIGNAQGEILKLDDSELDEYVNDVNAMDLEETGAYTKIVSTRAVHPTTKKCVDLVHIDMEDSEDFLDTVQLSCVDSVFIRGKGLIAYRGLVYLRDQQEADSPIWAVYYMKDHCMLRIYTDGNHKMIEKQTRKLTMEECKKVIDIQNIKWLPKEKKKPAKLPTSQKPVTAASQTTQAATSTSTQTATSTSTQTATSTSTQTVPAKKPMSFSDMLTYLQTLILTQVAWLKSKVPFVSKPPLPQQPLVQPPPTLPVPPQTSALPPQPINIVETPPPVLGPQPLTGVTAPRPPPVVPAAPPAPTQTTPSSPGLVGGLMGSLGLANTPSPKPIPTPPPMPPAPEPPKKGWFPW